MNPKAFTLIELLIVVAIIGILAAIAVPNFMNAIVRSKIAQVQSEMNSLRFAIENYRLDTGVYPLDGNDFPETQFERFNQKTIHNTLTTPIAYLSSILVDPFNLQEELEGDFLFDKPPHPYIYFSLHSYAVHRGNPSEYSIFSYAPDLDADNLEATKETTIYYHISNGLKSSGDIFFYGP